MRTIICTALLLALASGCGSHPRNPQRPAGVLDDSLFHGVWQSVVFESNLPELLPFATFTNLTLYAYRPGAHSGVEGERRWVAEVIYRDNAGAEHVAYPVALGTNSTLYVGMWMDGDRYKYRLEGGLLRLEKTEGPRYIRAELRKLSEAPGEPKHMPPWLIRSITEE